MKEIRQIKETCLYISDLQGAKEFYKDILELELIHEEPGKHLFFRAGTSVLLCFNPEDSRTKISPPPHFGHGKQHLAFEVADKDYLSIRRKLISAGIEIMDELSWPGGKKSFYFPDPSGNVLEIVPEGVWD